MVNRDKRTHTLIVGHEVPSVVVWPLLLYRGLGWEMLRDTSYDKAKSESKLSIHSLPHLLPGERHFLLFPAPHGGAFVSFCTL